MEALERPPHQIAAPHPAAEPADVSPAGRHFSNSPRASPEEAQGAEDNSRQASYHTPTAAMPHGHKAPPADHACIPVPMPAVRSSSATQLPQQELPMHAQQGTMTAASPHGLKRPLGDSLGAAAGHVAKHLHHSPAHGPPRATLPLVTAAGCTAGEVVASHVHAGRQSAAHASRAIDARAMAALPAAWQEFLTRGLAEGADQGCQSSGVGAKEGEGRPPALRTGKLKDVVRAALQPQVGAGFV